MKTTTRIGELKRVFKGGESTLLNGIGRLAILYEDLRLEMGELQKLHAAVGGVAEHDMHDRILYFLRRALATLVEFGNGLNVVKRTAEFKAAKPSLTAMDAGYITGTDSFLQQNWAQIKELRNAFAGHIEADAVEFAMKHLTNEFGRIVWNPNPDVWTVGMECDFVGLLLGGVIASKFQNGSDLMAEVSKALDIMSQGFNHAQVAMVALVHAFLWDRFGH